MVPSCRPGSRRPGRRGSLPDCSSGSPRGRSSARKATCSNSSVAAICRPAPSSRRSCWSTPTSSKACTATSCTPAPTSSRRSRTTRAAPAIARKVARSTGTLLAGDICNTSIYGADEPSTHKQARKIFDEQIGWAVDAGVDFIVGETYSWGGEALLALEAIKRSGKPAVITLAVPREGAMRDGWTVTEACKRLQDAGADVVGLNCARGPATMLPVLREVRAAVTCHVAALPVPYRTTPAEPT